MVFCGRPSKACQRCRARRLKCDLRRGSCGQCIRAQTSCSGYRDTQQLRIRNESQDVQKKASVKQINDNDNVRAEPRSLPLSLEVQAREAFFLHYVTGTLKTWDFLKQFSSPSDTPEHLSFSIDAVSLAYFSHQVYSQTALGIAQERYISALRTTNRALQSMKSVMIKTMLLSSMLLDLYEKITNMEPHGGRSWTSHVKGALALVKVQGLEKFRDPFELRVLGRLSTNFLISCVVSEAEVPADLNEVRAHCGRLLQAIDPKWRLSDLMVCYACLHSQISQVRLTFERRINLATELDARLQRFAFDMPQEWRFQTTQTTTDSARVYNNRIDKYPDRHITQTWNVSRLVRILLNESILECYVATSRQELLPVNNMMPGPIAKDNINILAQEICASAPQYLNCHSHSVTVTNVKETVHSHSPGKKLDCYTVIFPLYVAGRSKYVPTSLKSWVINQLHYMGRHFHIRNAELVAQTLNRSDDVNPWRIYAMLGSYAFVA